MTDDFLADLNSLVPYGEPDQASSNLRALTARLHSCEITGQDFLAADAGDTAPLPRHVLLCDNSPTSSPLNSSVDTIWRELSGSGRHYDGLYGVPRADGKIAVDGREIDLSQDMPSAPIGRQLALCLRVFNAASVLRHMPNLARAVQRHFNDILIANPVVLHPALLVPVQRSGTNAYMSVMHALGGTYFGSLPRANHYPRLAPELLKPHLAKLAKHPCLKLGMGKSWHVWFDTAKGRIRRKREGLVEHMFPIPAAKARFLGSVMEMEELAHPRADAHDLPLPLFTLYASDTPFDADMRLRVVNSVARCAFPASGVAPIVGSGEILPVDAPDLEFLDDLRKRMPALMRTDGEFVAEVRHNMIRALFSSRSADLSATQVAQGTDAIIRGLVAIELITDHAQAAQFVLDACLGSGRGDGNLPKADAASGIAFCQAIDAHGGFGSMQTDDSGMPTARMNLLRMLEAVRIHPSHATSYREDWTTALQTFWTEMSLRHELAAARDRIAASSAPAQDVPAAAPAVRRRAAL